MLRCVELTRITDFKRSVALVEGAERNGWGADFYSIGDVESLFTKNASIFRKGADGNGCLTDCTVAVDDFIVGLGTNQPPNKVGRRIITRGDNRPETGREEDSARLGDKPHS